MLYILKRLRPISTAIKARWNLILSRVDSDNKFIFFSSIAVCVVIALISLALIIYDFNVTDEKNKDKFAKDDNKVDSNGLTYQNSMIGNTKLYSWIELEDELEVTINVPKEYLTSSKLSSSDIKLEFKSKQLTLKIGTKLLIDREELIGSIKVNDSSWQLEGSNKIIITLVKLIPTYSYDSHWLAILKRDTIDNNN